MKIDRILSDDAVLKEMGERLAARRVQREQTQAGLAEEAGVSPSTVTRLEAGKSTDFANVVRVARALGLLANFDALVPEATLTPMERLAFRGKRRQRVRQPKSRPSRSPSWTWADDKAGDDK